MSISDLDAAVAMGAITQVRVLGGTIGLAIWFECSSARYAKLTFDSSTVLNRITNQGLQSILDPSELQSISDSFSTINTLDEVRRVAVRKVFARGYNQQMRIMTYFNIIVFLASLLILEKQLRRG